MERGGRRRMWMRPWLPDEGIHPGDSPCTVTNYQYLKAYSYSNGDFLRISIHSIVYNRGAIGVTIHRVLRILMGSLDEDL